MSRLKYWGTVFVATAVGAFLFMGCSAPQTKEQIIFPSPTPPPDTVLTEVQEQLAHKVDKFFASRHKINQFNGTVLVGESGKTIIKEAYGLANLKTKNR